MVKNKYFQFTVLLLLSCLGMSQSKSLTGKVIAKDEVEGIHILNKTALKFTVTDTDGSFTIPAKILDTLTISGLKYEVQQIVITKAVYDSGNISVNLKEKINLLDEVVVGKLLTGSLSSDMGNFKAELDINFYDLGIPGYTGKMPTQTERRLIEATTGGGLVPLNPILNWMSGRTKKLKANVKFEENSQCIERFKDQYGKALFKKEILADSLKTEYFYFCLDDKNIGDICKNKNPLEQIEFLQKKLKVYKANLATRDEKD